MISAALANVSDLLLTEAVHGRAMPPERAAHLSAILLDLSARVAVMEDQPIPEEARLPCNPVEEVAMLVDKGWTLQDARAFVEGDAP